MIGVDEAGRGCWAGPFLAVAVRLRSDWTNEGLNDSKSLSDQRRRELANKLQLRGEDVGYAFISADLIDKKGLTWAQIWAMQSAVAQIKPVAGEEIILDGSINYLEKIYTDSKAVIKADCKHLSVMAASILAKVRRDEEMIRLDKKYSGYGFARHKGYGTKFHRSILQKIGPCKIHRLSYRPLKEILTKFEPAQPA